MITCSTIGRVGRFGNACFQVAATIGIAVKSGQPYGFPPFVIHDNEKFGGNADNINDYLANPLPLVPEGLQFQQQDYLWGYRDLRYPTGNIDLYGHFQSDKYFNHCMPLIRETFRFKDEPEQNDYVAIHYRAGDYTEGNEGHHPRQTKEYYEKAMGMFTGSKFLVFTDDVMAANRVMPEGVEFAHVGKHYITDFKLMKRCRSFITANSSFSLFAAILGEHPDKKITCPSKWFGESMTEPYKSDTKDIYPENAIII